MGAVLINPGAVTGVGLLRIKLEMEERQHRLLFKTGHWNAIVRHGLHQAGLHYIAVDLGKRFTPFAYELGYQAKGNSRSPISRALSSGLVDRLADKFWMGWNPWRQAHVPGPLWDKHIREEKAAGRFHKSRTGWFSTEKRALRRRVKADLKRRVAELSEAGEKWEKLPLVETGDLREKALADARPHATATQSTQKLRIVIPQPHGTHPIVGAVLKRLKHDEIAAMSEVMSRDIAQSVQGSMRLSPRGSGVAAALAKPRFAPNPERLEQLQSVNQHRRRQQRHQSRRPAA